jgi:hypothetical protein
MDDNFLKTIGFADYLKNIHSAFYHATQNLTINDFSDSIFQKSKKYSE